MTEWICKEKQIIRQEDGTTIGVYLAREKELVRCSDCKHRPTHPDACGAEIDGKWCYWCELHRAWKQDDWFCADGETRQ